MLGAVARRRCRVALVLQHEQPGTPYRRPEPGRRVLPRHDRRPSPLPRARGTRNIRVPRVPGARRRRAHAPAHGRLRVGRRPAAHARRRVRVRARPGASVGRGARRRSVGRDAGRRVGPRRPRVHRGSPGRGACVARHRAAGSRRSAPTPDRHPGRRTDDGHGLDHRQADHPAPDDQAGAPRPAKRARHRRPRSSVPTAGCASWRPPRIPTSPTGSTPVGGTVGS